MTKSKEINTLISEISNFTEECVKYRETPDISQIIPRWRYCPEIDPIFYSQSSELKQSTSQLEARSMNSYLIRIRTFNETWPKNFISPLTLSLFGWFRVCDDILQQTEDVNKTVFRCKENTDIAQLQSELAMYGCSWILKPCKMEAYQRPVNFYTTMSYKNIVDKKDEVVPIDQFFRHQFKQMELMTLKFTTRMIESKLETINIPDYFKLPTLLRSLLNITDSEVGPKFKFIIILLLHGWCCKIKQINENTHGVPVLFCFLTGQKIELTTQEFEKFHPLDSHYHWSPWKGSDTVTKEIYDELFGKVYKSCRRIIRKRHKSVDEYVSNNPTVSKFMNSLNHLNSRKRRKSLNPLHWEKIFYKLKIYLTSINLVTSLKLRNHPRHRREISGYRCFTYFLNIKKSFSSITYQTSSNFI